MYPKNTTTSLEIKKKLKFIPHEVRAEGPSVADVNNFVKMCIAHCPWITLLRQKHEGFFLVKQKMNELPICEITMLESTMALPEFPKA